jgi:hypothetical protein
MRDEKAAFPGSYADGNARGMTLRDYFAGQALAGSLTGTGVEFVTNEEKAQRFSKEAYLLADAMLAEREKGEL